MSFINFGLIPWHGAMYKTGTTKDWFIRAALQVLKILSTKKQPRYRRIKPRLSSVMLLPQSNDRLTLAIMATPTLSSSPMCVATIWGGASIRKNTVYQLERERERAL